MLRHARWLMVVPIWVTTSPVWAQPQKTPEELFNEAKVDAEAKRFDDACPKFEASYRVSQKPGALLSWADCEENRNRLATSLQLWEQGATKVAADAERSRYVASRLTALRPRVPHISIALGKPDAKALRVTIDGRAVELSGGPFAVDPGEHVVVAKAEGTEVQTQAVTATVGQTESVTVLAPKAVTPGFRSEPSVARKPVQEKPDESLKIAGWTVSSIGVAGALAFGGTAIAVSLRCDEEGLNSDGEDLEGNGCPSNTQPLLVGNAVTLGVGVAGLGVGIGLLIAGYTQQDDAAPVAVVSGPGDFGLGLAWRLGSP